MVWKADLGPPELAFSRFAVAQQHNLRRSVLRYYAGQSARRHGIRILSSAHVTARMFRFMGQKAPERVLRNYNLRPWTTKKKAWTPFEAVGINEDRPATTPIRSWLYCTSLHHHHGDYGLHPTTRKQ